MTDTNNKVCEVKDCPGYGTPHPPLPADPTEAGTIEEANLKLIQAAKIIAGLYCWIEELDPEPADIESYFEGEVEQVLVDAARAFLVVGDPEAYKRSEKRAQDYIVKPDGPDEKCGFKFYDSDSNEVVCVEPLSHKGNHAGPWS